MTKNEMNAIQHHYVWDNSNNIDWIYGMLQTYIIGYETMNTNDIHNNGFDVLLRDEKTKNVKLNEMIDFMCEHHGFIKIDDETMMMNMNIERNDGCEFVKIVIIKIDDFISFIECDDYIEWGCV